MASKILKMLSFSAFLCVACGNTTVPFANENTVDDATQCEQGACEHSFDCPVGMVCGGEGCCEPVGLGSLGCDNCSALEAACAEVGCSCEILHAGGQTTPKGRPHFVLSEGQGRALEAILLVGGGEDFGLDVADLTFTLELSELSELSELPDASTEPDAASFVIDGQRVIGTAHAGSAAVTANFGHLASCAADLVNLGPRLSAERVRVHLFDQATGLPISGATVILDTDRDGIDDGAAEPTDGRGVTSGELATDRERLDVTVFAVGYDYLTVLGLAPELNEITLPLTPRGAEPIVAAATGQVDFDTYEREVLDGHAGSISMAMVASSFPMDAMVSFDLGVLLGGPVVELDCDAGDPCYTFEIPGVLSEEVAAWGGMVLSLPTTELKPHFEVVGTPGLRRAWSVGGQWEVADLEELLRQVLIEPVDDCACDSDLTCDIECSCDAECRVSIESRFFRAITPLLARASVGVSPARDLASVEWSELNDYLSVPYAERQPDPRFPVFDDALDTASAGSVELDHPLATFTTIAVPALPPDPIGAGLGTMEGMFVVTGVELPGVGFVPSGLGAAFDCTAGSCAGHQRDPASIGYDGVINGAEVCVAEQETDVCPADAPPVVEDGHVGLFHAPEVERGLGGEPRTVLLAVPVDSFAREAVRATAILIDGELPSGEVDWSSLEFPKFTRAAIDGRAIELASGEAGALARLDVTSAEAGWTVLSADELAAWTAPSVPAGLADPLAATDDLHASTTSYQLGGGQSLGELVANDGTSLADLTDHLIGFSTER